MTRGPRPICECGNHQSPARLPQKRCLMLAARVHLASSCLHVLSSAKANTPYDACRALAKHSELLGILTPSRLATLSPKYLAFSPAPISRGQTPLRKASALSAHAFTAPIKADNESDALRRPNRDVQIFDPSLLDSLHHQDPAVASRAASPAPSPPPPRLLHLPSADLHLPDSARRMVNVVAT